MISSFFSSTGALSQKLPHFIARDAQVEMEFLDAATGERLAAAIDRRVGGKSLKGKFDKWDDAKDSFDYWAKRMHTRYLELRSAS